MKYLVPIVFVLGIECFFSGCTPASFSGFNNYLGPGISSPCSYSELQTYSIGTDPTVDFSVDSVGRSAVVQSSTCSGIYAGETATPPNTLNVTRQGSTLNFLFSSTPGDQVTLTASGSTLAPTTASYCIYGVTYSGALSGSASSASNSISLNISWHVNPNNCSPETQPSNDWRYANTVLQGLWESACTANAANSNAIMKRSFSGAAAIRTKYIYASGSCSSLRMYWEQNGPMLITGTSGVAGTTNVTILYNNFLVKLFDSALVTSFNSTAMCGISNWTTGVDFRVNGAYCDFNSLGLDPSVTFPAVLQYDYDIFQISGTTLYFGDPSTGDGTTQATRPTALDTATPMTFNPSFIIIPDWAL